jgi:aminoglycoside 3-N-acetyltransferase I
VDEGATRQLNALFAAVFGDAASYASAPPSAHYLRHVLGQEQIIVLAALDGETIVGGLVAYVLQKLEQERSEIYIYDLAVAEDRRREGIATALIAQLETIASNIRAWVIYVQADYGDEPPSRSTKSWVRART